MSALKVHNATTSKPLSPTAESQGTQQGVAVQLAEGHGSCLTELLRTGRYCRLLDRKISNSPEIVALEGQRQEDHKSEPRETARCCLKTHKTRIQDMISTGSIAFVLL